LSALLSGELRICGGVTVRRLQKASSRQGEVGGALIVQGDAGGPAANAATLAKGGELVTAVDGISVEHRTALLDRMRRQVSGKVWYNRPFIENEARSSWPLHSAGRGNVAARSRTTVGGRFPGDRRPKPSRARADELRMPTGIDRPASCESGRMNAPAGPLGLSRRYHRFDQSARRVRLRRRKKSWRRIAISTRACGGSRSNAMANGHPQFFR